jgi:HK97 family phage prohead protease
MTQTTTQPDLAERLTNFGFQRRTFELTDIEFRADDASDTWTFEGVACTVDHPYAVRDWLGEYTETISGGAFKRTLNDPQARIELRWNHDQKREPYAVFDPSTGARSLSLVADPHLRVKATLQKARPDIQILRSMIAEREVTQMSIGFNDVKGAVRWNDDYTARTVDDLRLMETSIVGRGCNDLTDASIRSLVRDISNLSGDIDEAEIRRAIHYLEGLLPAAETVAAAVETVNRSGLIVTDEFIQLWQKRQPAAA